MTIDQWDYIFREGPTALTEAILDRALSSMKGTDREVVKVLVEHVCDQTKWIDRASRELVSETARIRDIGIVMRKAGLRSYTDKEGRIFVSSPSGGGGSET